MYYNITGPKEDRVRAHTAALLRARTRYNAEQGDTAVPKHPNQTQDVKASMLAGSKYEHPLPGGSAQQLQTFWW